MKIQVNRNSLLSTLRLITSVTPSTTPKPILRCAKIEANGKLQVSGTNLDIGLRCVVDQVEIQKKGEVAIEASRLYDVVRACDDDVLVVEAGKSGVRIVGVNSQFSLYCHEEKDFPLIATKAKGKAQMKVDMASLQDAIDQVLFAAARESSRYAINGVLWEITKKTLKLVTTDGRRLAVCSLSVDGGKLAGKKMIVPAKTMQLLGKLNADGELGIDLDENLVTFRCGDTLITSVLVEGNFPKYQDIIPGHHDKKINLSVGEFGNAVRRAAMLTTVDSHEIKISLLKDAMVLSGSSPSAGSAEVTLPITYSGEPFEIGFNPNFLTDILRAVKDRSVRLELGLSEEPALMCAGKAKYVVMPVNLGDKGEKKGPEDEKKDQVPQETEEVAAAA